METDADPDIRAMSYYVESPENIENLFDGVIYDKGEFTQPNYCCHQKLLAA